MKNGILSFTFNKFARTKMSDLAYADHNPMLQNLYNPVPNLGVISGKCRLDYHFIAECQANAEDPDIARYCYPGGANDINHDAMPGDSSFGIKCVRSIDVMEGEPNELGIVALAGINRSNYESHRTMEDQFYWQGFVATESRLTNALNSNTSDPDHGYATIRVGTVSTINNGPSSFYPGQYVSWRFPKAGADGSLMDSQRNGNGQITNLRARGGTPNTQFRPELVPFDYTDFETQIASGVALAAVKKTNADPGIADVPFEEFFRTDGIVDAHCYAASQETAAGYKYGKLGVGFAMIETLARAGYITLTPSAQLYNNGVRAPQTARSAADYASIADQVERMAAHIGTWSTQESEQTIIHEILANMYFRDLPVSHVKGAAAANAIATHSGKPLAKIAMSWLKKGDKDYEKNCYYKLRVMLSHFDSAALVGSWYSKTSKIIGRAMNACVPAGMSFKSVLNLGCNIFNTYTPFNRHVARPCWAFLSLSHSFHCHATLIKDHHCSSSFVFFFEKFSLVLCVCKPLLFGM